MGRRAGLVLGAGAAVLWGAVGLSGIGATVAVSLLADRMAHRNRLTVMQRYFEHVLSLPLSFHGDVQSGRLMKVMLVGSDNLFSIWLSFFRDHFSTFVAAIVLLPLTMVMNWRLGLLLIVLVVVFAIITAIVIRKTEYAQGRVEMLPEPAGWHRPGRAVQRHRRAVLHPAGESRRGCSATSCARCCTISSRC